MVAEGGLFLSGPKKATAPLTAAPIGWHHGLMRMLKALRVTMRIPKQQLADTAGVSLREVTRAETDGYVPGQDTLLKLDQAFASIQAKRLQESRLGAPMRAPAMGGGVMAAKAKAKPKAKAPAAQAPAARPANSGEIPKRTLEALTNA